MVVLLQSPLFHKVFICFLNLILLLHQFLLCGIEFHVVMALCSTVRLPQSGLDLGTVKRPLVACLVGYVWVSELCACSLDRQLGAFNMSIPLIKKSSDEVNLSSTFSQERLTCILLILALCVHPRASRAALF